MAVAPESVVAGWLGWLQLVFAFSAGRTALVGRRHQGPLLTQRPFYPEGGVCHSYLLHPPGGVVGGDRLELEVACESGAHALMTTPAAGKFYRSDGRLAVQRQRLTVAADAVLEWLPQEQIVFRGAEVDSLTRVELAAGARFIGWEVVCLGRRASGEAFEAGHLRQRFELWRAGRPLWLERSHVVGGSEWLHARCGLAGYSVVGTLVAVGATDRQVEDARAALPPAQDAVFAVTRVDDVLVARYLGHSGEQAREVFGCVWAAVRPPLLGRDACAPRIWRT
jgi:urease accessory protein